MKKNLIIAAASLLIVAACKKDRTCTCTNSTVSQTSTEPGYTYTPRAPTTSKSTYKKIKKSNVNAQLCVSSEDTYSYNYTAFTGSTTANYVMTVNTKSDCELK